ncbi:MAG: hypothetical protein ACIAXF_07875 [Phycisphaerales bacterium JB063]
MRFLACCLSICLTPAAFAQHWAPQTPDPNDQDTPYIAGIEIGGGTGNGSANPGLAIVIPEGSTLNLNAYAADFDQEYSDATCGTAVGTLEGDETVVAWSIDGNNNGVLRNADNTISVAGTRLPSGERVVYHAPTLGQNETSRDVTVRVTPDDLSTAAPGSRPAGDTGNRNDDLGDDVTITVRVVRGGGPVTIDQVRELLANEDDFFDWLHEITAANPGNRHYSAFGATQFEMEVGAPGAQAGDFNAYFIEEAYGLHPDNDSLPGAETDTSNFVNHLEGIGAGWELGDLMTATSQGFVVGVASPESVPIPERDHLFPFRPGRDDTFYDTYLRFNVSPGLPNGPFLTVAGTVKYYGRHTYAYDGALLETGGANDAFKVTMFFRNEFTGDLLDLKEDPGHEFTYITWSRTPE